MADCGKRRSRCPACAPRTPPARVREPRALERLRGHGPLRRPPHALPGARRPRRRRRSARAPRLLPRPGARAFRGDWREYRVARQDLLVSDFTLRDDERFVALERDNAEGLAARHKQAFEVTLDASRTAAKRRIADLLDLRDPAGISLPARAGDIGLGDPFKMPYQTIEAVLPLGEDRLAIVNDTNFGSRGRYPVQPDYSDFVVISTPRPSRDEPRWRSSATRPMATSRKPRSRALSPPSTTTRRRDVVHLGDIKNGSTTCDDARFIRLRALYDTLR